MTTAEAIRPPRGAFAALTSRSYRIYLAGQSLANIGTWMQSIAQDWLIFDLTHSSTAVGVTMALQFLPMLLFGLHAGLVADRLPKRSILLTTQTLNAAATAALAVITHHWRGATRPRCTRSRCVSGLIFAFDGPARQAFVDRGRAARPAARRDRAERGGVPGDPADRPGHRQPAHRQRRAPAGCSRSMPPATSARLSACCCCGRPICSPAPAARRGARSAAGRPSGYLRGAPGRRCGRSSSSGCSARSASTSRSC